MRIEFYLEMEDLKPMQPFMNLSKNSPKVMEKYFMISKKYPTVHQPTSKRQTI